MILSTILMGQARNSLKEIHDSFCSRGQASNHTP